MAVMVMREYPVYEEMKDSGLPWVGKIPKHWKVFRAKNILKNISEKNKPDATVLSLYRDHGVVPKDSRDDNHNVTSLDTSNYKYVKPGNLVINKMKAWQGSLAVSDYEGIVSPAYYVCQFLSDKADKKYVHYLLRCKAYAQEFERLSTGMRVGQWDLEIDDFMRVPLLIPPISEQAAIAAYLDDQCGKIDALIAETKESIEEYKKWKQSIIFEAVTKGLDPDVEMKDSGVTCIGRIPSHWSRSKIKYFVDFFNGDRTSRYPQPSDFVEEGVPFLTSANIDGDCVDTSSCKYITAEKYSSLSGAKIQLDDIVFCLRGSVGKCAVNKHISMGTVASSLCTIRPHGINSDFLLYCLLSEVAKRQTQIYMNGTCAANLSAENVSNYHIPLPPMNEQAEIGEYLISRCTKIDSLITEKTQVITTIEIYKRSLIYETVTGKRKVVAS